MGILENGDNMEQDQTPLLDVLKKHSQQHSISFHVPGHKNGQIKSDKKAESFFRNVLQIDATELTGLDDLHSPEGAILEAEHLLSAAYGVQKSFFLVNGSTVGNLAMMLGVIYEGDTVFIQRNCHKSILNGIELTKAKPVLLEPEYHQQWGVAGGVTVNTVKEAYEAYPDCKAILLTYPTYYGMVYELAPIIKFAHERDIPVLIDEAHGAHFSRGDYFPDSAIKAGADVVVQSAHKTLPAMTMGSFLHINSSLVSTERINHYLRILQSSSPSYPIMASLDLARKYVATYTIEDQRYAEGLINSFKRELRRLNGITILKYPDNLGDPLKLTIQSTSGLSGFDLQALFENAGVYTELADPYNILLILPLLKKDAPYPFDEAVQRIRKVLAHKDSSVTVKRPSIPNYFKKNKVSTLHLEQVHGKFVDMISIQQSEGYICAESIVPYPPGVPLLIPGEVITKEVIESLLLLLETGGRFQGGTNLINRKINVFK